jgi:membrane protease YdiL (CAAX protease family)
LREPEEPSLGGRGVGGRAFVRMALFFYGAMLGVAGVWSLWVGDSLLYATDAAAERGIDLLRDVTAGALAAGITIWISREWTRRTRSGERLARALGALIGPLSWRQCLVLALASGVAEEAFFRGAIQPRVGLVAASLIFGLAHFAPRRELAPWTVFSVAAGLLLGTLFDATGNLVAPVVAHAGINAVNLKMLSQWTERP